MDARGDVLVAWPQRAGDGSFETGYSWRPAHGAWMPARTIGGTGVAVEVALTPLGRGVMVLERGDGYAVVSEADVGEAFAPVYTTPTRVASGASLAVDDAGDEALGWVQGGGDGRIMVAERVAGAAFGSPTVLGVGANGLAPRLAMNPAGAAVAAWSSSAGGAATASYRPPAGAFGAPERAEGVPPSLGPLVGLDLLGDAVVATSDMPAPGGGRPAAVRFAVRSALGGFGAPRTVEGAGSLSRLVTEPDGSVTILFAGTRADANSQVGVATRRVEGTLVGPTMIGSPGSCLPDAAVDRRDLVVAAWIVGCDGHGSGTQLVASERGLDGRFGPETPITEAGASAPRVAVDEAGDAAVVYMQAPADGDFARATINAAVRDAATAPSLPPQPRLPPVPTLPLKPDGSTTFAIGCAVACRTAATGLLHVGNRTLPAVAVSTPARATTAGRRVRLSFGRRGRASVERGRTGGRAVWLSVSVTATGRAHRSFTTTRRYRVRPAARSRPAGGRPR